MLHLQSGWEMAVTFRSGSPPQPPVPFSYLRTPLLLCTIPWIIRKSQAID